MGELAWVLRFVRSRPGCTVRDVARRLGRAGCEGAALARLALVSGLARSWRDGRGRVRLACG